MITLPHERRRRQAPTLNSVVSMPAPLTCPAAADLEQPAQFDAMLRARASSAGDIVITILGPTSGARAIQMGKLGWLMLANMLANLGRVGVTNHLAITTHLHLPAHADNNLCLSELRPRGVCCAWAGVGMRLVAEGTLGRTWTISETHPYLLFLQRWWFTSQAAARGYNVLSLDTDMHLDTNPLAMMRALPILQPTHPPTHPPTCLPAGLPACRPNRASAYLPMHLCLSQARPCVRWLRRDAAARFGLALGGATRGATLD